MKPLDRLSEYLGAIERRLRLLAVTRGAAVTAVAALALTVVAVMVANRFAFSNGSVVGARVFLFLGLAYALAAALIVPVIRLNRRHAAREAERKFPHFEERLLTFQERVEQRPNDPFLNLLAEDALSMAQQAEPQRVAKGSMIFGFSTAALAAVLTLLWLGLYGPDWLGYGTSLLWGGLPKGEVKPYYAVRVEPGNKTIRKRSDLMISATLMGFQAPKVRFFAKYASGSKWEQADMQPRPGASEYQFLIAGVPESLEYYVEAGGVRSEHYNLKVVDLPAVKRIRVTYHFPRWSGMKDAVEDPGGDLRAVEGTDAEVAIETDRPLANGALLLDDGSKIALRSGPAGMLVASVPITKDGLYHVAAIENGEDVRMTEDYFIESQKDQPPEVKISRPGRDFRATPIEEVTVAVDAKDDFGLKEVTLHYSVNGGPEKAVSMLSAGGAKNSNGATTIALEDYKVQPGDIVSLYATAKDARKTVSTDMFFIEAQPFERNYSQSQQDGGGGGDGGGGEQQNEISQRQKEIITATWNQLKGQGARGTDAENAGFLSGVQSKLRDQAKSLADRMKARQLEGAGDSFKSFVEDMDKAVQAMGPAADQLKGSHWQDALPPEQKALQYLLRAESTFRDIQVAFGGQRGGGGGGGGGASRDMQGLFDLELDTEKNQYESARSTPQSASQQQQAVDEALQKLKELARRQQELAEQQRKGQQTTQQRWEQELLRREAEKLQQQLQQMQQQSQQGQLSRGQQGQSQSGQSSGQSQQQGTQQSQSGQQGQQGQQGQNQQQQQGRPQAAGMQNQQQMQQQLQQMRNQQGQDPRLNQANAQQMQQMLDRLKQAMDDMRGAASSQQNGTPQGEAQARRAADRLKEAEQMLAGMQSAQAGNEVESLARQADDLARKQQDFEGQMRRAFGENSRGVTRDQAEQLAQQKDGELGDLKKLEQGMQNAVRNLQSTQRQAATRLRNALGEMQQQEIARDMQRNAEWIRRGMGQYATLSESEITAGLNDVRDQLKQVQQAMAAGATGKDGEKDKAVQQALDRVQQLRQQLEALQQQSQRGQQGGQQGQQRSQQGQLSRGQQGQQQQGQQGGQQQGGQQQGGQQQGGQQQGGQQQGGQQQGGQQQGGQQQGGQQQGANQQGGSSPQAAPNNGGNWGGYGGRNDARGWGNWTNGPVNPQQFQQTYRDAVQSLQQLQQGMRDDPNTARDIQGAIRDLRQLDPFALSNDPVLIQRIAAALAGVEQVEMELRRKVEDTSGTGSVRSPGGEKVPQGYEDKVADYYRKLGKSK
jgi:hypothetical protein